MKDKEILEKLEELYAKRNESSVDHKHFDIELHNAYPLLRKRALTAEAELQKARERVVELETDVLSYSDKALYFLGRFESVNTENTSLRSTVARMEGALKQAIDYHESHDLGEKSRQLTPILKAALQPAQSAPPLAPTAMDWDDRLPYVPEKKTEGLSTQSADFTEAQISGYFEEAQKPNLKVDEILSHVPETMEQLIATQSAAKVEDRQKRCPCCVSQWDSGYEPEAHPPTPPQEQKTGGGEAYEREWIELNAAYNWLWKNCRIVFWPKAPDYPIEHNPHARKESRGLIEYHMTKALGQVTAPTQPEVDTVGGGLVPRSEYDKLRKYAIREVARNAWLRDPEPTDIPWETRLEEAEKEIVKVENWKPAPLSTQSPQPKEGQSHE